MIHEGLSTGQPIKGQHSNTPTPRSEEDLVSRLQIRGQLVITSLATSNLACKQVDDSQGWAVTKAITSSEPPVKNHLLMAMNTPASPQVLASYRWTVLVAVFLLLASGVSRTASNETAARACTLETR